MTDTGLANVVAEGGLRGFSVSCDAPITILLDGDPDDGTIGTCGRALRLLAGVTAPLSGRVTVLGGEPLAHAPLRLATALLGDDVLLDAHEDRSDHDLRELSTLRAVPFESLGPLFASYQQSRDRSVRRALADRIANPDAARLLLLSSPESYGEGEARDAAFAHVRAAVARGAKVVIATRRLDEVLSLAPDDAAVCALVSNGVVVAVAKAHAVPWAVPAHAVATRPVRIVLQEDDGDGAPPSARLASDLLCDREVAAHVSSVQPVSANELHVHTRDPRALARAIGLRAKGGLAVRALSVVGATATEIAAHAASTGAAWTGGGAR